MNELTIDELKSLEVGDWVWVVAKEPYERGVYLQKDTNSQERFNQLSWTLPYSDYGTKWVAYKNKEQAEAKEHCVICHKDISMELPKIDTYGNHYCGECYSDKCKKELLKAENEELKAMHTFVMEIKKDNLDFSFNSEAADMFLSQIIQLFKQNGAKNFLTMAVGDPEKEGEKYSVTIQKASGATPAEIEEMMRNEITNLMAAKATLETDKANLERTIKEMNEVLKANCITIDCDGNVNDSRVEEARKQTAKEILQELINIMNAKCDDINSDELHYVIHKYDVEVDE